MLQMEPQTPNRDEQNQLITPMFWVLVVSTERKPTFKRKLS
jgi:hypothetical protein